MPKMKLILSCIALTLAGCATAQLNQGLESMLGSHISTVVSRLGYPNDEREVMGDKIYIWSTSRNAVLPITTTSTTAGSVGNTPVYGTTNSTQLMPVHFSCTIQIATDPQGIVKSYEWQGNEGGCRMYANRVRR